MNLKILVRSMLVVVAGFSACSSDKKPEEDTKFNQENIEEILVANLQIKHIRFLERNNKMTPADSDDMIKIHLAAATLANKAPLDEATLAQIGQQNSLAKIGQLKMSTAQKVLGWFDFGTFLLVLAIIVGTISCVIIFSRWIEFLLELFQMIPYQVYEFIFYSLGLYLIYYGMTHGYKYPDGVAQYFGLAGCFVFGATLFCSMFFIRESEAIKVYLGIMTIFCGLVAIFFLSSVVGYLAVLLFMAFSGVILFMDPWIGLFETEDNALRAAVISFGFLAVYVTLKIWGITIPEVQVFYKGAIFFGASIGFSSLLVLAIRWYSHDARWFFFQIVSLVAGLGAIFFGTVFNIPDLKQAGGSFFVLFLVEKVIELLGEDTYLNAFILLVASCLFGYLGWVIINNANFWAQYIFFL